MKFDFKKWRLEQKQWWCGERLFGHDIPGDAYVKIHKGSTSKRVWDTPKPRLYVRLLTKCTRCGKECLLDSCYMTPEQYQAFEDYGGLEKFNKNRYLNEFSDFAHWGED